MTFEWDAEKSDANLRERGFDFAFASLTFDAFTLERQDHRMDYGEVRTVAVGIADGVFLTVVYTDRTGGGGDRIRRIISARRSSRREREAYEAVVTRGTE